MKKTNTQFQIPTNKDKLCQGTQQSAQKHHERRNPASNHWGFMEMLLDMVNQNIQEALKKLQDNTKKKIKNMTRHKNK
jgi:hypothetical protein